MGLVEFANQMSEILCGYREGKIEDMLNRAKALVELEKTGRIGDGHKEIEEAAQQLLDTIEDVRNGW